jgi:hypothetical protein
MGVLRYVRKDGTQRWSQPLRKSWQYVKKLLKLSRADLRLYSTRRLMADWLDYEGIAQRTRDRVLEHASDVRGRYGRKGILDPADRRENRGARTPGDQGCAPNLARSKEPRRSRRAHRTKNLPSHLRRCWSLGQHRMSRR